MEKNELMELELLKHVETTPHLNNRLAASKLGCSVKLSHALLKKMASRGLFHIIKHHARRWDYFLTPKGIAEKTRLTYEFLEFSMQFYHEARKLSSQVCKDIAVNGLKTIAFVGAGDLAEIAYLGVKEWGLELIEVFDNDKKSFLSVKVKPLEAVINTNAEAILVCLYDKSKPMRPNYLPPKVKKLKNMYWIFNLS